MMEGQFTAEQLEEITRLMDLYTQDTMVFWIKSIVLGGGGLIGMLVTGVLKGWFDVKKKIESVLTANAVLKAQNEELRSDVDKLEKKVFK